MVVCGVGSIGVHLLNVGIHSFQAELMGVCAPGENFAKWISLSYVAKRFANCVCVFGSIIFFEMFGPRVSYQIIGTALLIWGVIMYAVYWHLQILPYQVHAT